MNILVTGGAGFIGSNLIKRLVQEGHYVESLDNYETGLESNEVEGCNYISRDIEGIEWYSGKGIDVCFHLAGLARIQPSFTTPNETIRVNSIGTQKVLQWAHKFNVKVVYAGSSSRWHNPFLSPYAFSKHIGEEFCKMYRTVYNVNVDIARFYNVYGPKEIVDGDYAAVIGLWRRQVRDNKPITIVGDGSQRRDFTHVDDIVDGLIRIAKFDKYHEDAWELGTGKNYSINEVYEMFFKRFNVEKTYIANQPGNYKSTLQENTDAQTILGWNPSDKLQQYILNL